MSVLPRPAADHAVTARRPRILPWAWSIPVLVLTQFAMLALIPTVIVVRRTWRGTELRPMRPWAAALAVAYATPLLLWAAGPDREGSLSKDMHPASALVLVVVAAVVALRLQLLRGQTRTGAQS